MLNFDDVEFDYLPYPIGVARNVIAADVYAEMLRAFPEIDQLVKSRSVKGVRYQLSRRHHWRRYRAHIRKHSVWREFYDYVRSDAFPSAVFNMLERQHINTGLRRPRFQKRLKHRFKAWRKGSPQPRFPTLRSRFQFMAMPATGGCIPPHTDHPAKRVTLVVSMVAAGEWDPTHGGGTSVVCPKDQRHSYNLMNHYMPFDEVETINTYAFQPNQSLIFIKTCNSWHAVWPMGGNDPKHMRRTLVINIEAI